MFLVFGVDILFIFNRPGHLYKEFYLMNSVLVLGVDLLKLLTFFVLFLGIIITLGCPQAVCWWTWRFGYYCKWWRRTTAASKAWETLHINTCRKGYPMLSCLSLPHCFAILNLPLSWLPALPKGHCQKCRRIYNYRIQASWNRWVSDRCPFW